MRVGGLGGVFRLLGLGDGAREGSGVCGVGGAGLSFAVDTPVATPSGARPIASLQVGDQVLAYDPSTGQMKTQTIAQVFLNHDTDRLDVTLALPASQAGAQTAADTAAHTTTTTR